MKLTSHSFSRLVFAFVLSTQLLLLAPAATRAARSSNDSISAQHEGHTAARSSARSYRLCRERCLRQYRQCLRGVVRPNRARCGQRYRACLGRCRR
ncbi:MAG TPA: hypothetical protein VGW12_03080 [Pyrinomonadaceae bacterium]|nr:hypothetical protein [Pyrinomonadaceae bacterium]